MSGETLGDESNARWRTPQPDSAVPNAAQVVEAPKTSPVTPSASIDQVPTAEQAAMARSQSIMNAEKDRKREVLMNSSHEKAEVIGNFLNALSGEADRDLRAELKQCRQDIVDRPWKSKTPENDVLDAWQKASEIMRQLGK